MSKRNMAPFALGMLALGFAASMAAAPAARADGSEGMGTQILAEMAQEQAIRNGAPGWQNGMAALVTTGSGQSVVYTGTPNGHAGMGGTIVVTDNADGNPVVEHQYAAPSPMMAMRR